MELLKKYGFKLIFPKFDLILISFSVVEVTCFTCSNSTSNNNCNRLAIDRACPEPLDTCETVHVMETRGDTRGGNVTSTHSVEKHCSTWITCARDSGCDWEGDLFICR